jgi:hypothetical protein
MIVQCQVGDCDIWLPGPKGALCSRHRADVTETVESRNASKTDQFIRSMRAAGFAEDIKVDVLERQLYDDLMFLLERVSNLPDDAVPVVNHVSADQIVSMREDYRNYRIKSVRVKTEGADDRKVEHLVPFNCRPRKWTWDVVCVWITPSHVAVELDHAFDRPVCDTETVEIDSRLMESKFATNPLTTFPGERIRPRVFEPSHIQINAWKKRHSKDGVMKTPAWANLRLDKHRRGYAKYESAGDNLVTTSSGRRVVSGGVKTTVNAGKQQAAMTYSEDRAGRIADDMAERFGEAKPQPKQVYDYGKNIDVPSLVPPIVPPHAHDEDNRCVFGAIEQPRPDYVAPSYSIRASSEFGFRMVNGCLGSKSDSGIMIGGMSETDESGANRLLIAAQDWSREKHDQLGHYCEYQFRYYPPTTNWLRHKVVLEVFNTFDAVTRTETVTTETETWNTAVRNTFQTSDQLPFGELTHADIVPADGWFVRYQFPGSAARVYRVFPLQVPQVFFPDFPLDDIETDGDLIFGLTEIHASLREQADLTRSRNVGTLTARRRLREQFAAGDIRYIRFRLTHQLEWCVEGDSRPASVSSIESVSSSR